MTAVATTWLVDGEEIDVRAGALVGILNVTPDSFSDGGEFLHPPTALARGLDMLADGAALIDVGGESTRPGAHPVDETEERRRLLPVVRGLVREGARLSVDTYKPGVARAALDEGAKVVNDVTGFTDPEMIAVVTESRCGVVIMHMRGTPADMQDDPRYDDVVVEVEEFLLDRATRLEEAGVDRRRIAIDPGIGFGKTAEHNLELLSHLGRLAGHGLPVMIGTSRKRFLGRLVGRDTREFRDRATAFTTALGFAAGARLFRVHDVAQCRDALGVATAIVANQQWDAWLQG